jgi:hypothetical protein
VTVSYLPFIPPIEFFDFSQGAVVCTHSCSGHCLFSCMFGSTVLVSYTARPLIFFHLVSSASAEPGLVWDSKMLLRLSTTS